MTSTDSSAKQLINWIVDTGINGFGPLPSAQKVAKDHLKNCSSVEEAINSVIVWRTTHAAGTGFVTGLGGLITLPVSIPASLASSYALGANTAGAIAILRGYNIEDDRIRTLVLLSLIGKASGEVLKTAGIHVGSKITQNLIKQIPGKVLIEINKKVGFRLITKAGEKGVVNLMKVVPLVGGVVGAGFDGTFVNACGQTAKRILK